MVAWGREVLWDEYTGLSKAWISREAVPDMAEAIRLVAADAGDLPEEFVATAVLVREQSEVEARIEGNEWPCFVECTKRARKPEAFWRVERSD